REEFHAFRAGGAPQCIRDELVENFSDRLQPSGHQGARAGGAEHQGEDQSERDQHEQCRIGEGNLGAADVKNRKQILDLELMDGIHAGSNPHGHCIGLRARGGVHRFGSSGPLETTPAARITLSMPAAKPRSRNTISPQGEIPSKKSSTQPNAAPTRTPATSSVESRKPRAIADGSEAEDRSELASE